MTGPSISSPGAEAQAAVDPNGGPELRWEVLWGRRLRWFFAALLLATAVGKLLDMQGFYGVVRSFQVLPEALIVPSAWALTLTEFLLADLLLLGWWMTWVSRAVVALHTMFWIWLAATLVRGIPIDNCGCFGVFLARPLTGQTLVEDGVLLALAAWMAWAYAPARSRGPQQPRPAPKIPRGPIVRSLIAVGLAMAGLTVLTALTVLGVSPRPALANPSPGAEEFPSTWQVGQETLVLNGAGRRVFSFLKVQIYSAALYLPSRESDSAAILASDSTKVMAVRMLRGGGVKPIRDGWEESFKANCIAPCLYPAAEVQRFLDAVPAAVEGADKIFVFHRGGRVEISHRGRPWMEFRNPEFSRLLLATWLGPSPPTPELKVALLGKAPQR